MDDRMPTGYTLVELLIGLAVLAILMTVALPTFADLIDSQRLRAAAHQLIADLRLARNMALTRPASLPVGVQFQAGTQWCYGISRQLPCNCNQSDAHAAAACRLDQADNQAVWQRDQRTHPHVQLLEARFSGASHTLFDARRGTARAGHVRLRSARGKQLEIRLSSLGRLRICTPADTVRLTGYSPC